MAETDSGSFLDAPYALGVARLLDRVAEAARKLEQVESERAQAREELRAAILAAREEGITLAAIGRAAGLSRQRIRQLVEQR